MRAIDWPRYYYGAPEVLYVHDGDTLRVKLDYGDSIYSHRNLRLIDVWAPELGDPGGPEAKALLQEVVMPSPPAARPFLYVQTKRDAYSFNRLLAWVYIASSSGDLISVNDSLAAKLTTRSLRLVSLGAVQERRLIVP